MHQCAAGFLLAACLVGTGAHVDTGVGTASAHARSSSRRAWTGAHTVDQPCAAPSWAPLAPHIERRSRGWTPRRGRGHSARGGGASAGAPEALLKDNILRLAGGWGGGGRAAGTDSDAVIGPTRTLATTGHTHMSFYGFMFDVRAARGDLAITEIEMASTTPKPGPFLYNVYMSTAATSSCLDIADRADSWVLVGSCRATLPWRSGEVGHWGALRLEKEILVRSGRMTSIYIHCPESAEGVAYRHDIDDDNGITDADDCLELRVGYASFAYTPFTEVQDSERAFAGVLRYRLL